MSKSKIIVVTGATGRQGGAVARLLLNRGWRVRALTRNASGPAALALAQLGAEVVAGNLDSRASLQRAFEAAHGVFGVTDFWEHGYDTEVRQGRTMVDAAVAARVRHFVFNSVGGTERTQGLGITHFDGKREIEHHLCRSGLAYTIFRPVTFLENFITPRFRRSICNDGLLRFGIYPDKPFQMVAMQDVGRSVARAFEAPGIYLNQALELASDQCTMLDFVAALGEAVGRPVRYQYLSVSLQRIVSAYVRLTRSSGRYKAGPSLINQFRWNNASPTGGWNADLMMLRELNPELTRMRDWVRGVDWWAGVQRSAAIARA